MSLQYIQVINQVFEMKQKLEQEASAVKLERNFNRLFHIFEEEGFVVKDPFGEKYSESRTDCEANIVGREGKNMMVTQVIKPIIYKKEHTGMTLAQKGIVMVENK